MAVSLKNVYIFISSTFNDMHAERDYLIKQVFPELREWCAQRKLNLIDIDLRWGVTEQDATQNKRVVQVCLERIDACRPFFLCFLGQRRGWVPSAADVSDDTLAQFPDLGEHLGTASVTEMEILHALIHPFRQGEEFDRVKYAFFYLRDPAYLQSLPDQPTQLRQVYTNEGIESPPERAVADGQLQKWREEIIPAQGRPVRTYQAHWTPSVATPELAYPLQSPSANPANTARWRAQWQKASVSVEGEDVLEDPVRAEKALQFNVSLTTGRLTEFESAGKSLKDIVLEDLQQAIAERFTDHMLPAQDSPLQRDLDQQEQFVEAACQGFIARQGDFSDLEAYLQSPARQIFALTAPAGVGKTTLLAAWLNRLQQIQDDDQTDLYYRFIGASDDSTSVDGLLRSLLGEVMASPNSTPVEVPAEASKLRQLWARLIHESRGNRKVVLVLDALNQLETGLADLTWLPLQLPENVKLVISFKRGDAEAEAFYQSLKDSGQAQLGEVQPFDSLDDRQKLVREYLSRYLKELDQTHIDHLIHLPGSANPLYLKIMLSELRVFGVFSELSHKIAAFGDDPVSAFQGMLERLETDPVYSAILPGQAVPLLFSFLAHARHGLAVDELAALMLRALSLEDTLQNRSQAQQTINLFLRQVRPYLAARDGRFDLFFESFKLAVIARYSVPAGSPETLTRRSASGWQRQLASYFADLPLWIDGDPQVPNVRKTAELPFHLAASAQADAYTACLSDFDFLYAKIRAAGAEHLLEDYQFARLTALPLDTAQQQDLTAIQRAIQLSLSNLRLDADLLAGQLIGRLSGSQGASIESLIRQAHTWTTRVWLRPVITAMKKPDSPLLQSFLVSDKHLLDTVVSPDGSGAVTLSQETGSDNLVLKGWEVVAGRRLWLRNLPAGVTRGQISLAPDGQHVVGVFQNALAQYRLDTGQEVRYQAFPGRLEGAMLFLPDGRSGIVQSENQLTQVFLETGETRGLHVSVTGSIFVQSMALSASGRYLGVALARARMANGVSTAEQYLATNAHDSLLLVDLQSAASPVLISQQAVCDELVFTPDEKYIVTANEIGRVEMWETATGRRTAAFDALTQQQLQSVFQMSSYSLTGSASRGRGKLRIHPSGDKLFCCFGSGYLKSLDISRRDVISELRSMYTPESVISLAALDETFALSTSIPNSIEIWNVEKGELVTRLLGEEHIDSVTVCRQDQRTYLLTRERSNILRWWEVTAFLTAVESGPKTFDRDSLSPIYNLAISKGDAFVAAARKMSILVMNPNDASPVLRLPAAPPPLAAMQFLPSGTTLAAVAIDGEAKLWDMEAKTCVKSSRFPMPGSPDASIQALSVTPDGKWLVLGNNANQLQLIDLEHGKNLDIGREPLLLPADLRSVRDDTFGLQRSITFGISTLCVAPDGETLLVYANLPDLTQKRFGGMSIPGMGTAVETEEWVDVYDLQTGLVTDHFRPSELIQDGDKGAKIKVFGMAACHSTNAVLINLVQRDYLPYDKVKGWVEQMVYDLIRYDVASKTATTLFTTDAAILDFSISPDDRYCLVVLEDGQAAVVSLEDGRFLAAFRSDLVFKSCALAEDGITVFLGDEGGGMYLLKMDHLSPAGAAAGQKLPASSGGIASQWQARPPAEGAPTQPDRPVFPPGFGGAAGMPSGRITPPGDRFSDNMIPPALLEKFRDSIPQSLSNSQIGWPGLAFMLLLGVACLYVGVKEWLGDGNPFWYLFFGAFALLGFGAGLSGRFAMQKDAKVWQWTISRGRQFLEAARYAPLPVADPYVTGKVVTVMSINGNAHLVDWFFSLNRALRPQLDEEVGTVLIIRPAIRAAGSYNQSIPAYAVDCQIDVVDLHRAAVVGQLRLPGETAKKIEGKERDMPDVVFGWPSFRAFDQVVRKLPRR